MRGPNSPCPSPPTSSLSGPSRYLDGVGCSHDDAVCIGDSRRCWKRAEVSGDQDRYTSCKWGCVIRKGLGGFLWPCKYQILGFVYRKTNKSEIVISGRSQKWLQWPGDTLFGWRQIPHGTSSKQKKIPGRPKHDLEQNCAGQTSQDALHLGGYPRTRIEGARRELGGTQNMK